MTGFHVRLGAMIHAMVRRCARVSCLIAVVATASLSPQALARTWIFETIVNDATTRGWTVDIVRGAGGKLYAGAYASGQCAIYSRDPVSGNWSPEVSSEFNRAYYDLAVDQTGRPFVLASDGTMSLIRRNDNGTWTATLVSAVNHAEGQTLTFDSQNRPVVSWVNIVTHQMGYVTYNEPAIREPLRFARARLPGSAACALVQLRRQPPAAHGAGLDRGDDDAGPLGLPVHERILDALRFAGALERRVRGQHEQRSGGWRVPRRL
jgi:hypothetical protein